MKKASVFLLAAVWVSGSVWAGEIGAVSGVVGKPFVAGKAAHVDTKIADGDEVITGAGEAIALCLDSKVVIKLDAKTAVKVTELPEKTEIRLERGNARVYIAKRDASRPVVMVDPKATVEAHGTVFLGHYDDQTQDSSYSVDESNISVNSGGTTTNVGAGQQANYSVGQLLGLGPSAGGVSGTFGSLDQSAREESVVFQQRQAANLAAFSVLNNGRNSNVTPVETNAQGTNSNGNNDNGNNANNGTGNNNGGTNENGQAPAGGDQTESTQQAAPPLPTYNVGQLNQTSPIPAGVVQNQTVMNLIQAGSVPGLPGNNSGGVTTSTGGFSDITAHLSAAGTLPFSVRDNGIPDGDTINLSVVNNGATVLTQQNVVLTGTGQNYAPAVAPGTVDVHIVSVSDGEVPPNTGQVTVSNVDNGRGTQSYSINQGDEAILHIAANAAGGPSSNPAVRKVRR